LQSWLAVRLERPIGPLFYVINGPTRGRHRSSAGARAELRRTASTAFADASLPISFDTPTRSRWPAKAYRWSSSRPSMLAAPR
jgi:hypothetical protein